MTPRPAATVLIVRDAHDSEGPRIEALVVRRTDAASFAPGFTVFPGGTVDGSDSDSGALERISGQDTAGATELLERIPVISMPQDAHLGPELALGREPLAFWIAAWRETFEEVGLLFGDHAGLETWRLEELRHGLAAGEFAFDELLATEKIYLDSTTLLPFARFITPEGGPRRFDTHFFFAVAPDGQIPSHDGTEVVDHSWLSPKDALNESLREQLKFMPPTQYVFEELVRYTSVANLLHDVSTGAFVLGGVRA